MPSPRLARFLFHIILVLACACGDSSAGEQPAGVPFTVFFPGFPGSDDGAHFATLQYRVTCESDLEDTTVPTRTATLEARDASYSDPDHPADVWRGVIDADSGDCVVSFEGLAENGELMCAGGHNVTLTDETSALYLHMSCGLFCPPPIEFPATDSGSKTLCLPTGSGLVLSAETPRELAAESVRVVLTVPDDARTPYTLDPDPIETVLARWWLGLTDFGNGPVPTSTWKANLVIYNPTIAIELTALDAQGAPLCRVQTRADLVHGAINTVHIAMPCADRP
jgi:hypothetical protein